MKNKSGKEKQISRRGMLPILGSSLLIPFLGFANSKNDDLVSSEEKEEYQTLLKPDGTTVKVKVSTLKKSKVVKKNISNNSLLNWLGK
jgi:hypothetical protein